MHHMRRHHNLLALRIRRPHRTPTVIREPTHLLLNPIIIPLLASKITLPIGKAYKPTRRVQTNHLIQIQALPSLPPKDQVQAYQAKAKAQKIRLKYLRLIEEATGDRYHLKIDGQRGFVTLFAGNGRQERPKASGSYCQAMRLTISGFLPHPIFPKGLVGMPMAYVLTEGRECGSSN
jgi:hypothetical protein